MTAIISQYVIENETFKKKWGIVCNLGSGLYVMARNRNGVTEFAPMYIYSFQPIMPYSLNDAEKYNIAYINASEIQNTSDKLRYFRYKKAMRQCEVADSIGVNRATYCGYESGKRCIDPSKLEKLAEILDVRVGDLLGDDYYAFLSKGQGKELKALRNKLGFTQIRLAQRINVDVSTVKRWESQKAKIPMKRWKEVVLILNSDIYL